jgi:biotin carboxyl carrier protein
LKKLTVQVDGGLFEIGLGIQPAHAADLVVEVDGRKIHVQSPNGSARDAASEWFIIEGRPVEISIDEGFGWIETRWGTFPLRILDQTRASAPPHVGDGRVKAPIPGQVTHVAVRQGEDVHAGQPLLVLEAMKMENEIRAPKPGTVALVNVKPGQRVALNELLLEIQ